MEHFFSQNSSTDRRSDAHQSQIIGGDAGEDHTQIVGGIQSNYWGGYIPPSTRVSAPLHAHFKLGNRCPQNWEKILPVFSRGL